MQDRYAGDIGDFSKLSLLRSLFNIPSNKIGLVWYRFPDEDHNTDGRHIDYLVNNRYLQCDNDLIKQLSDVVVRQRTIQSLEDAKILPDNSIYFSESVEFYTQCFGQTAKAKQYRTASRLQWLNSALDTVSTCNVVVLDPDNGLQPPSVPNINQKKSGKYAYYSEINEFVKNKSVVVIYHHLNRKMTHIEQIIFKSHEIAEKVNFQGHLFAIRFQPYSPRVYFFIVTLEEVEDFRKRLLEYLDGPCGFGWDSYYETAITSSS